MIKLQPDEARVFSAYIYSLCGIHLDDTKGYLLESRLAGLLSETGSSSFSELYMKARSDASKNLARKIVDAVTTGETSFFRDSAPFDMFQYKLLPEIIDRRKKTTPAGKPIPLRIWSAACSTGQEVYTIAIKLKETLPNFSQYSVYLLGTDISDQAVAKASLGIYNSIEIGRGLGQDQIGRYFTPLNGNWKIRDDIRGLVSFRKLNLMEDFSSLGRFDVIFCRNVAIYFTEPDKIQLFRRIGSALQPDGGLIIGSTESLSGLCPQFEAMRHVRSVFYRLK